MATASDLARQLNPTAPRANSNPQGNDIGTQLQNSVSQNQQQYGADYTNQRNDLLSQIGSVSVGGSNENSNNQDYLAPNAQFFSGLQQDANSTVGKIAQVGQMATDSLNQSIENAWQSKLSKLNSDYQANSANLGSFQFSPGQLDSLTNQSPVGADPNSPGARAVAIAQQVVKSNVPYVWGGNSLTQGVDCSGLVQQVYARLGIQLPRTSTEQAKFGKIVPSLGQAMPGDLILEYSPYEPQGLQEFGHVGIYIGNGMVIEAPGTGKNVRIGPIVNMTRIVRPW